MKPPCACGNPSARRGYCWACYTRWNNAGRPEGGPPPGGYKGFSAAQRQLAAAAHAAAHERRLRQYAELIGQGVSAKTAARRLGVSIHTAYKYNRRLRDLAGVAS